MALTSYAESLSISMKLTCAVLAIIASLAILIPMAQCSPPFELGGFGNSLSDVDNILAGGFKFKANRMKEYDSDDDDDDGRINPDDD